MLGGVSLRFIQHGLEGILAPLHDGLVVGIHDDRDRDRPNRRWSQC